MAGHNIKLNFAVLGAVIAEEYEIIIAGTSVVIKLATKAYFAIGDIEQKNLDKNLRCPRCGEVSHENKVLTIFVGNMELLGVVLCTICKTILICKFDMNSEIALKRILKIDDDLICQKWNNINYNSPMQ